MVLPAVSPPYYTIDCAVLWLLDKLSEINLFWGALAKLPKKFTKERKELLRIKDLKCHAVAESCDLGG